MNLAKSHVYFGGLKVEDKKNILDCLHIKEGSFPLKYLGIPLRPTKWKVGDCGIILKKITLRLHSWASRHLLFAGRAQLIHSVLLGIRFYWMSIFVLPQSVTLEIDRLCQNFLWGSTGLNFWEYKLMADVSWYWRKLVHLKYFLSSDILEAAATNRSLQLSRLYFLLLQQSKVSFAKVIWCNLSFLKHRFILWQSVFGHKLTRDNLLLRQIKDWLGIAIWPSKYSEWIAWMDGRPKGLFQRRLAATLAATVYVIWLNCNSCIFNSSAISSNRVVFMVKASLKARLLGIARTKLGNFEKSILDSMSHL
ncbi:uncharacterized protein LOC133832535 [Humulus lupulus]|uniref:uncharacterized protein LOC133832535 n=1 Tax=Humulus lupulus TaxID=3486 RepID=UPI002B4145DC|nr:uncharacterized protein LOC133832535 [Humulus lupulus]